MKFQPIELIGDSIQKGAVRIKFTIFSLYINRIGRVDWPGALDKGSLDGKEDFFL